MKKYSLFLTIIVLVFASLACQSLSGGSAVPQSPATENSGADSQLPTELPAATEASSSGTVSGDGEFPVPDGAINVMDIGGALNFQAPISLDEAMKFYTAEFTASGYTERPILTVVSDTTFSMVFDGHASGKSIVVQGVDMGDGTVNINIRLEDV